MKGGTTMLDERCKFCDERDMGYCEGYQASDGDLPCEDYPDYEDGLSDVEADAMTLASAGWGTDEDYGFAEDVL